MSYVNGVAVAQATLPDDAYNGDILDRYRYG